MEKHIFFSGIMLVTLSLVHIIFPFYFKWKIELNMLSLINRQMMTIHTFFIALVVFLMGLLCITSSTELVETALGKKISLGLGVFWTIRLYVQFFGYSTNLWKGKQFETIIHILFCILWCYLSFVFVAAYFQ